MPNVELYVQAAPTSIDELTTLANAVAIMRRTGETATPVHQASGALVGVVELDRIDPALGAPRRDLTTLTVSAVMGRDDPIVDASDNVAEALDALAASGERHLLVLRGSRLIGWVDRPSLEGAVAAAS